MLAIRWQDSEVGNPERVTENKMSRGMAGFSLIYVGAQVTKNARKLLKVNGCRGRDTDHSAPPAQNRTCASTHTASTSDSGVEALHGIRM